MEIQSHQNSLETNVKGENHEFVIGNASVVIDILRNRLYANKIQTLAQEYLSNCRDAHRELGKFDNAFEVTIPNRLNPIFKVRDFGPGISPTRMTEVFIKYGNSTKRDSNVQTGGFGLGSKIFWSYTDSFSITTFIDGIKRSYVAHTGVNNQGRLDLINTENTTEPNGTEIQGAVKQHDCQEFKDAVYRAIYFWDKKPIIKGELSVPPPRVVGKRLGDLEVISNDCLPQSIRPNKWSDEVLAVIDGIPYTIGGELVKKVKSLHNATQLIEKTLVVHFGNGIVQVSASREKIDDSPFTVAALEKIGAAAYQTLKKHIVDAFAKATTTPEFLQTYMAMNKDFKVDKFSKFGDYSIESGHIYSPALQKVRLTTVSSLNRRGNKTDKITKKELTDHQKTISIQDFESLFFINKAETKVLQGKRIRAHMVNKTRMITIEPLTVVELDPQAFDKDNKPLTRTVKSTFLDTKSFDKVIKDLNAKSFHDIAFVEEAKIEKEKVKREDASLCLHTMDRNRFEHTTLASNTQEYLYVPLTDNAWPSEYSTETLRELSHYLFATHDKRICGVAERALKMVKGNANFSPLKTWLENYKANKTSIASVISTMAVNNAVVTKISSYKNIEDPFVLEMFEEYKGMKAAPAKVPEIIKNKIQELPEVKEFKEKDGKFSTLMNDEYPLVGMVDSWRNNNVKELVLYMNLKYTANKKGGK
jgi:hypothetical protein